jgi:hypothetical protein
MRALEQKVMACLAEGDCADGEEAGKAGSTD